MSEEFDRPGDAVERASRWRWRVGVSLVVSGLLVGFVGLFIATQTIGTCKDIRRLPGGGFECDPPPLSATGQAVLLLVLGLGLFAAGLMLTWRRPPRL